MSDEEFEKLIDRLNFGNSEKNIYDFEWDEDELLNYADDSSLEIAFRLIDNGKMSLQKEGDKICISSYINTFCYEAKTNEDYFKECEINPKHKQLNNSSVWRYKIGHPMDTTVCHDCKYQSCPKLLAAYILYLKNQGKLKEKLNKRNEFRNENNTLNSYFLFELKNNNGLKKIDDASFEFAKKLVDKDYIRMARCLIKGRIDIESICSCRELQLSNMDIEKVNPEINFDRPLDLYRYTDFEPDVLCNTYGCRLSSCILQVAGYIYYLKKSGQEDKIKEDREYYANNKEEIDNEISAKIKERIEEIEKQKKEKIQGLVSSYEGKIENINLALNSILESNKTNFHCIVAGDEEVEKTNFIEKAIELLKFQNKIQNIRKLSISDFTRLYYHYTNIRINASNELVYEDNDREDPRARTVKFDKYGTPYHSEYKEYLDYKIYRRNKLEENAIYILDGIQEFVDDFHSYSTGNNYKAKKMMMNALDILTDMSTSGYIIINAKKDEIDPFIALDSRLKFVYQNNIIAIPNYSIDDMYDKYLTILNSDIVVMLKRNEEEYRKSFNEYVSLNQKFMPFDKMEIVSYMATYANSRNNIVFPPNVYKKENLDSLVGLKEVKEKMKEFEKYMLFQIQAKANEINISNSNMHMIFTGNPGTGKTTVARIMAKMLYDLGVIKENKCIEVERKDLVAQYIGQTAMKTSEVIEKAMGGVLFIDEAYSLADGSSGDFGREAIATLIKAMEDHKDKFVVIFAGYKKEMKKFLDLNSGIASRVGYTFDFLDYSVDELMEIFYAKISKSGFTYEEAVEFPLRRLCEYFSKRENFGNGRFIDKVIQETLMNHAINNSENIRLIKESDIPTIEELNQNEYASGNSKTVEEMLSQIVGMESLKKEILSFENYIKFVKEAEKQKIKLPDFNMHMIFTGNPGTGKTTIARIIAKMLFDMEVIHENKLVEVERKDLVAGYVGQTAIKTSEVIESALGGVLFIDEAYSLAQDHGTSHGFGDEAIATLIKAMEDHKGEFIVIFAGYKKEMKDFIETNPGIASRIGYIFNFEDYTDKELTEIFNKKVLASGMKMEDGLLTEVQAIMKYFYKVKNIGNGRFVDKVFSKLILNHSQNFSKDMESNDVMLLKASELPTIQELTKTLLNGNNMIDPSKISKESIRKTAIHEIGHATVGYLLLHTGFKKITCTAEGMGALGYVEFDDTNYSYTNTKGQLLNKIKTLLAGIGAEEVFIGIYENGGSSDLEKATYLARDMITIFGMSDLGLAHISSGSTELERLIYEEENKILEKCFEEVKQLITENKEKMERIVNFLLERGEITEEEFVKIFNDK